MKIKHITQYLFESYKDAQAKFAQEASEEDVKQYLDTFKQLAKKGTVSGQEKDIGYWIKQGWNDFREFVDSKSQEKSKSQVKKSKKKDSIIAHEDNEKIVVIPLSKDSSCYYGKNTKWCTSATESKNYFVKYFYIRNIVLFYVFMKETDQKYAAAYSRQAAALEYFDELDKSMSQESFKSNTGIDDEQLMSWYKEYKDAIFKQMDINNASEQDHIEAVQESSRFIRHIDNPSEEVQLEAVKKRGDAIRHIDNPNEQVQIEAVKQDPASIQLIKNPKEKVKLTAVKKNPKAIQYINNPSEELQLYSIKNGSALSRIHNPTETVKLEAVKMLGVSLETIDNPTEEMQLIGIRKDPYNIKYIDNPTPNTQIEAVKLNPVAITEIKNPIEEVQFMAIKKYPDAIGHINNPTEKAKELYKKIWDS